MTSLRDWMRRIIFALSRGAFLARKDIRTALSIWKQRCHFLLVDFTCAQKEKAL